MNCVFEDNSFLAQMMPRDHKGGKNTFMDAIQSFWQASILNDVSKYRHMKT